MSAGGDGKNRVPAPRQEGVAREVPLAPRERLGARHARVLGLSLHVAAPADEDELRLAAAPARDAEVGLAVENLRSPRVVVTLCELPDLAAQKPASRSLVPHQRRETRDLLPERVKLVGQLLSLQAGEPNEPHGQNRVRLPLAQRERLPQRAAGRRGGLGSADDLDDLVDIVQCEEKPLDDVLAILGLAEVVRGSAPDHGEPVVDPRSEDVPQVEFLGPAIDEGKHDDAERVAELRLLEQRGDDLVGLGVALEFDHEPDAVAVGFIAQIGDRVRPPRPHEACDLFDHPRFVHLVRELGHDKRTLSEPPLLQVDARAHVDPASSGAVGGLDAGPAPDVAAGREVGPGQAGEQLVEAACRVRDEMVDHVEEFHGVVRRNLGGHADRDPVAAVEQEVRKAAGEHVGFGQPPVEVRPHVDGVALDVVEQVDGQRRQPHLGIAVGGRRVPVDRTEIALTIDERVTKREVLHHAHHRVVDGPVPVRMVSAEHVAHDRGALLGRPRRVQPLLPHRIQDPAMNRLQAVARVRQRPLHDHAHRVVDE